MIRRVALAVLLLCVIFGSLQTISVDSPISIIDTLDTQPEKMSKTTADPGVLYSNNPYIILELTSGDIPARGSSWSQLLTSLGIPNLLFDTTNVISDPSLVKNSPGILVDASLGSSSGNQVSQTIIDILIQYDSSLILTGRSAWLLHRLSGRSPPSQTAPAATLLLTAPEYSGAVFLSYPNSLSPGFLLTSEVGLVLPVDEVFTEVSQLVNLTSSSSSDIAPLRYDTWPLDVFSFAPENPEFLTSTGLGLLENTIAFSTAIRETNTTTALATLQSSTNTLLEGGFHYMHQATITSTYYAVHAVQSLLEGTSWDSWVIENRPLVHEILDELLVDYGSEAGFSTSKADAVVNCRSTAQGLWLVVVMGLSPDFSISEFVTYLSSRQNVDGGFENYVTTTYHVTEALWFSGHLGDINTYDLELWLRSLVIDGSKTSNPDLWGSIGSDPTSISPLTNYAIEYLRALGFIGKAHPDPAKLTSWILTRTSNGDGSFRNSVGPDEEVVTGTSSALASMEILGTLSPQNVTSGLNWLLDNQLPSGGFGMKTSSLDLVAKTRETSRVSLCLDILRETSGALATGILDYVASITTDIGFEVMDVLPSLMWTSWLMESSRLVHATSLVDFDLARSYLSGFEKITIYPFWSNLTTLSASEYGLNQYRTKSVWVEYFGVKTAETLGVELDSTVVSDVVLYLSQSQYVTGHYRPTSLMGTAHMQHSVAAVEALYLLDELDTILYKTNLEAAILSEYNSGSWSTSGWTLEPFAGSQQAIDYLSTRAALRLGIITSGMAAEIATTIEARIQYTNLLALSYDVATLSLLQNSAFSIDLDSIDSSLVLSALRSSHFGDGWFNDTHAWQPVYTQSILRMISILGIRCQLYDIDGLSMDASSSSVAELGSIFDISISITSITASHSVLVTAFDESLLFTDVANSDTLHLPISSELSVLGDWNISIMLMDWGSSRAFHSISILVQGSLEGSLSLDTPTVKMGELVNGSATWTLLGGSYAGQAHVTIRLGDPPNYHQWSFDESSPFSFSVSSTDFDAGLYPIVVTITVPDCTPLVLSDEVIIVEPDLTYLQIIQDTDAFVSNEVTIDWSLHYMENDTMIGGQVVSLVIRDSLDIIVFTDTLISSTSDCSFRWTPSLRGDYIFTLSFDGNGTLDDCTVEGNIHVYESTELHLIGTGIHDQYSIVTIDILLETSLGEALTGQNVHIVVTSPTLTIVLDTNEVTNSTGHVRISFTISENGFYTINASYLSNGFLLGSSTSDSVNSWSLSTLVVGGVSTPETIGESLRLWAQLEDSMSNPIPGQSVTFRIILLPSTTVLNQVRTTNSTGYVSVQWTPGAAGAYKLEVIFAGTLSRSSFSEEIEFDVLIPVTLSVAIGLDLKVGTPSWIEITARNHLGNLINGLSITIIIEGPEGQLVYSNISTTSNGIITFQWLPSERGINDISLTSVQQGLYHAASLLDTAEIFETPQVLISVPSEVIAPSQETIYINITDLDSDPIQDISVHVIITLNSSTLIEDDYITDIQGSISISVMFSNPGYLELSCEVYAQGYLLDASSSANDIVTAETTIVITIPGQPIEQGSTVGILVTLRDFNNDPLTSSLVTIEVTWSNGTVLRSVTRTTDSNGQCTLAQTFNYVGDFIIHAIYAGYGLNSSSSDTQPQRVFVTPSIHLHHAPSCIVGEVFEFEVNLTDALGNYIADRIIELSIEQDGSVVFEVQVVSIRGILTISWYPSQGGLAEIAVTHMGDIYYLEISTFSTGSVMELITGELWITPDQIDLFDSTLFVYNLSSTIPRAGVTIHFEVLGMDLVPIWSADVDTNSSGMASIIYTATETHGILHVNAAPLADEFLLGGDVQEQLIVMTTCTVLVSLLPTPPTVNHLTNITISVLDDLGLPIDGPTVTVTLYNPFGEVVKLGAWTNSITVPIEQGLAIVEFTPTMVGLYTVSLTSSGAISVHGFTHSAARTVYSTTQLILQVSTTELEVGQNLSITSRLLDHNSAPLVGRNVVLFLDGPGTSSFGPTTLVTNATGHVTWSVMIDDEGLWTVQASFSGLGVYLPASSSIPVNVRYGTVVQLSLLNTDIIIAGLVDASFSILLEDSGGTPLEGFTVQYAVYHEILGLVNQGNLIQSSTDPIILNMTLDRMGLYTIVVSFVGTSHYHSSNAGLEFTVFGTTTVISTLPGEIQRDSEEDVHIFIEDEVSIPINLSELVISIELIGPESSVNLTTRLVWGATQIDLITYGFPTGHYTLSIVVQPTEIRIGCSVELAFDIESTTRISITQETLSGIISESHSLTFVLIDCLDDIIENAEIWVSLYDPLGREIYGHPLSTRTLLHSSLLGTEVSWTPTLVGEYRWLFEFEGDTYLNASSVEVTVLIRHESMLSVDVPLLSEYGEIIPVTITLEGSLGGLVGETVILTVSMGGIFELEETLITGSRGVVSFNLVGLLAGSHTVTVSFGSSDTQASCSTELILKVTPVIVMVLDTTGNLFVGHDCTVNLSVSVLGTDSHWNGTLEAILFSPEGEQVDSWFFEIDSYSVLSFNFLPVIEGRYSLNVTVSGLPVTIERQYPLAIAVVYESLYLSLDAGTPPMLGGFGILAVIGLFLRKRMKGVLGSFPSEWSS